MAANLDSSPNTRENDSLSFRRVKPLPKRRRMAGAGTRTGYDQAEINSFSFQDPPALAALADLHARPYFSPLSAQRAIRELFTTDNPDPRILADFTGLYANPTSPPYRTTAHHNDDRDEPLEGGEYVDHFQLPSNTKKRKIPGINHSTAFGANEPIGLGLGTGEQQLTENVPDEGALPSPTQRPGEDTVQDSEATLAPNKSTTTLRFVKNQRQSLITRAGLRRKALIHTRRKQFYSVLEELPEGDPLALELALTARYPQLDLLFDSGPRDSLRMSRRSNAKSSTNSSTELDQNAPRGPSGPFTFAHPCSSSERMVATRAEAERYRLLFLKELELHTERAIEAAEKVAATVEPPAKSRKRTAPTGQSGFPLVPRLDSESASGDQALFGKSRQKKKKRSALANASNPHHLRNYVPSRLPQQAPPVTQASLAAANFLSPPPLRFLSAQIAPRRRRRDTVASTVLSANLVSPIDEWICATCEYNLFYGDENAFRKGVRNRKRILSRRRRARERAAVAAGGIAPAIPDRSANVDYPDVDSPVRQTPMAATVHPRVRRQVAGADVSDTLK